MIGAAPDVSVIRALERVPPNSSGALVRERTDGTIAGALLVERGRVCWAMSQRYALRLTDLLVAEQASLSHSELEEVVAMCRRDRLPLGETLVTRGVVSLPVLQRALLRHTCEAFMCLLRDDASPWTWLAHSGYGYSPMLTFSVTEVFTGAHAVERPALAALAQARLREVVHAEQRGFAVARHSRSWIPIAQIGCEDMDLAVLGDLAAQAVEIATVTATVAIEITLVEFDGTACAIWSDDDTVFVLLYDGELAFNRLLAHAAMMTTHT